MARDWTKRCRIRSAVCGMVALAGLSALAQVADFDGDGDADVLLRNASGRWSYHAFADLDVASAQAERAALTPRTTWQWAAGGDFDGDGRQDVLLRREDGAWVFYPLNGARVVAGRGGAVLPRGRDWRPVGVADLNGDGRDDVLLRRENGQWAYYAMNGRSRIRSQSGRAGLPVDLDWRLAGMGDFDGDGRADVLLRHVRGAWRLYAMDGRHPAREGPTEPRFTRRTVWRVAGVGDFDGDGADDVLIRNHRGVWRYQSMAPDGSVVGARPVARLPRAWAWRLAGIGDLDGDGSDDVLLRHADGRWRAAPTGAGSDGRTRPVGLPEDLSWRVPQRPVHLPDAVVRDAVADALGLREGSWITARDFAELAALEVRAAGGAGDLTGLGAAHGLRTLVLVGGDIADLGPLAGLTNLTSLAAPDNRIADLAPLAGLTALTDLRLAGNRIGSVAPLSSLTELGYVELERNGIVDISPLARLKRLTALFVSDNRISDIAPLRGLSALAWLGLDGNGINDLGPVAGLTGLRILWASRNLIRDISPLARLTLLEDLDLSRNRIADISALAGMTALRWLRLAGNEVADLAPLAELVALESLEVRDNGITDVAPLAGMALLAQLRLADNRIRDISPLSGLTALRYLDLAGNVIADVTPLSGLASLATLDLGINALADISPLAALPSLSVLKLGYNFITDISPLEALPIGEGGVLDVRSNPLNDSAAAILSAFAAGGVEVASGGPRFERIHGDNVAVIRVESDIAAEQIDLAAVSWTFLTHFEDVFDFLFVVTNVDSVYEIDQPPYDYPAASLKAKNDVRGIGLRPFYLRRYGSAGQLNGLVHMPDSTHFYGYAPHEVLHTWGNSVVPTSHQFHWGFSSANGSLGGFDIAHLVDLGGGRYTAGVFGTGGQLNARRMEVPYSPIELYLAGYVPPGEVPDLWVAEDGAWAVGADGSEVRAADGMRVFTASVVRTYTIEDIVARNGERLPASDAAQRHFRSAAILVTSSARPATPAQLDRVSAFANWFSMRADDGNDATANFWEATGGRGSFVSDGLNSFLRPDPAEPTGLGASFGRPDADRDLP